RFHRNTPRATPGGSDSCSTRSLAAMRPPQPSGGQGRAAPDALMIDLAHSECGGVPDVPVFRIGTRASALALWQTERVRAQLAEHGYDTERVEIRTTGDIAQDVPLAKIGGRAFFTKQLDDAILEGRIDVAVHSLKDLPTEL